MMQLNKVCDLADFRDPEVIAMIRWLEPDLAAAFPGYPRGREHRKSWEHQQMLRGCLSLNAFEGAQSALVANAGDERIIYALTHFVPEVHALDNYGPDSEFLKNPRSRSHFPFDADRLHLRHLDAEAPLPYPDASFDLVFGLRFSSHPTYELAQSAFSELARVLKPGGYLVLVMDMVVDGGVPTGIPGGILHSPESIEELLGCRLRMRISHPLSTALSATAFALVGDQTTSTTQSFPTRYPHVLFRVHGRTFTSSATFLEAVPVFEPVPITVQP